MAKNCTQRFCIAGSGLALNRHTLSFMTSQEIQLYTSVFMVIIEFTAHLSKEIGNQIFIYSTFISKQVAFQNIRLRSIFKHRYQKSDIHHVNLELALYPVPIKRQFRNFNIITSFYNTGILYPLKTS